MRPRMCARTYTCTRSGALHDGRANGRKTERRRDKKREGERGRKEKGTRERESGGDEEGTGVPHSYPSFARHHIERCTGI